MIYLTKHNAKPGMICAFNPAIKDLLTGDTNPAKIIITETPAEDHRDKVVELSPGVFRTKTGHLGIYARAFDNPKDQIKGRKLIINKDGKEQPLWVIIPEITKDQRTDLEQMIENLKKTGS
jgi:hypothetical protein